MYSALNIHDSIVWDIYNFAVYWIKFKPDYSIMKLGAGLLTDGRAHVYSIISAHKVSTLVHQTIYRKQSPIHRFYIFN